MSDGEVSNSEGHGDPKLPKLSTSHSRLELEVPAAQIARIIMALKNSISLSLSSSLYARKEAQKARITSCLQVVSLGMMLKSHPYI